MSRYRFDAFVFDPADGRLEHAVTGESTTLRPQVAALLARLLESPRTVVDREALCRAVWGEKAVVDFESGLAAVVRELRQAFVELGGTAELLETMPRRGYRLLADVMPLDLGVGPPGDMPGSPNTRRLATRWPGFVLFSLAGAVLLAGLAWWLQKAPDPAAGDAEPGQAALAVLPFERFGAPGTDGTRPELLLADSLLAELWRADLRDVVLIGRATLRPYQGREDVATAVARDLGARLLVEGSIVRNEADWQVTARLLEMPGGRVLWLDTVESSADVLPAGDIAARLAESLARAWATQAGPQALQGLGE
ncbi:winged helix-turn-helix domain-containing protein [Wenzhouxiangella sp. XN24]|uniref:winged helix-turn-helix domain-containing protein n=1 Tax=Wenzhouxiangella sp. XN24 TaxID=2713569 RepID=UPI0013EB2BBC|nr:hypothetical protein [Wenzhouxiangella sp. XN24]